MQRTLLRSPLLLRLGASTLICRAPDPVVAEALAKASVLLQAS